MARAAGPAVLYSFRVGPIGARSRRMNTVTSTETTHLKQNAAPVTSRVISLANFSLIPILYKIANLLKRKFGGKSSLAGK